MGLPVPSTREMASDPKSGLRREVGVDDQRAHLRLFQGADFEGCRILRYFFLRHFLALPRTGLSLPADSPQILFSHIFLHHISPYIFQGISLVTMTVIQKKVRILTASI